MASFNSSEDMLRQLHEMPRFQLRDSKAAPMKAAIFASIADEGSSVKTRRFFRSRIVVASILASAAALLVCGTVVYKLAQPQLSHANKIQAIATKKPNQTEAQRYYLKELGFQPMLPSYIPEGMKLENTSLNVGRGQGLNSGVSFSVQLMDKGLSPGKVPQSLDTLTLSEEPLAQFNRVVDSTNSLFKQKQTIQKNGLTVRVFEGKQIQQEVYEMSKGGISYALTVRKGYKNQDELWKILGSLSVPEKKAQRMTFIITNSLAEARSVYSFQINVPAFLPKGFKLLNGMMAKKTKFSSGPGLWAQFIANYADAHHPGTFVEVFEEKSSIHDPMLHSIPSTAKQATVSGHKVYYHESSNIDGVTYTYQWKDPKSGLLYTVQGVNPKHQTLVSKATLRKVVASMFN